MDQAPPRLLVCREPLDGVLAPLLKLDGIASRILKPSQLVLVGGPVDVSQTQAQQLSLALAQLVQVAMLEDWVMCHDPVLQEAPGAAQLHDQSVNLDALHLGQRLNLTSKLPSDVVS
jgi:hypothetical protein